MDCSVLAKRERGVRGLAPSPTRASKICCMARLTCFGLLTGPSDSVTLRGLDDDAYGARGRMKASSWWLYPESQCVCGWGKLDQDRAVEVVVEMDVKDRVGCRSRLDNGRLAAPCSTQVRRSGFTYFFR